MASPHLANGLTPKRERFAQLVAQGHNYADAYRQSFTFRHAQPASIWQQASHLAANVKVASRIAELRRTAAAAAEASVIRTIAEAARIAYVDPASLIDPATGQLLDVQDIPEDARRAIAEVVETYDKDGNRHVKYKLWNKLDGIEKVAKLLRMPGYDRTGEGNTINVQVNQLDAYSLDDLLEMREALRSKREAIPVDGPET